MKGSLTLIPVGGLGNRMRAVGSACAMCSRIGSRLKVVWFREWNFDAPFNALFLPIDESVLLLREARRADFLTLDRPRRRNLWLPALPQKIMFSRRIYEQAITPLKRQGFDFDKWAAGCRCYMSCYQEFGSRPAELCRSLFRPVKEIMSVVEKNKEAFSSYTVGMHIRRTDNAESVLHSPTSLFVEAGKRELQRHDDMRIFLATDSEHVKDEMRAVFGDRIITPESSADRGSVEGIRGGVADMYTLSLTRRIYGSAGSTFSVMASQIGGCSLTVLSDKA